jgi:PTS system galactitol-specific IIC component
MNFDSLIKFFNDFLNLGVPVVAPSMLFLLAILFRVPLGRAVRAAITYGIGFIGIFAVLNYLLLPALSDVAQKLAEHTGLTFEVMDVGWAVLAAVAYGVPTFVTMFIGTIVVNLVMFIMKWTKTLDIDFHNYYHWVLPATVVYFTTGNLWAGTIVGLVNLVITLKIADWTEKDVAEWWDLPGVSIPHMSTVGWYPFANLMDWILDRIPGINKIRIDTKGLQEKIGVLGEPMLIGVVLGIALGIAARMSVGGMVTMAMNLGASMVLMPRMISLLMEGLVPVFQAARKWMLDRFPDYDFRIGLDAAVLVGKPEVLINGMIMVPVMVLLAILLPGNKVLPFADLAVLSFFTTWAVGVNRGNLFRSFIISTIICAVILYGAGFTASTLTQMGTAFGYEAEVSGLYTSLECGAITGSQLINLVIFSIMKLGGWAVAGISIVLGAVSLFVFKKIADLPKQHNDLTPKQKEELYPSN